MVSGSYVSSIEILFDDFHRLTEFVEPVDSNLKTHSHRLYELLLRACTDFESACKERLVADGSTNNPNQMGINDYKTLERTLQLEKIEVGILIWRPDVPYIRPFANWSTEAPPLCWYHDYNQVKHNRNTHFPLANLNNVRLALSGLFALLVRLRILDLTQFGTITSPIVDSKQEVRTQKAGALFSFRCPPDLLIAIYTGN